MTDLQELNAEVKNIKLSELRPSEASALAKIREFFVPTANAWVIATFETNPALVGGAVSSAFSGSGNLIKRIFEFLYKTFLRILVNRILNAFQSQILNWIAGGGKPKFVTNWRGFLSDAFNEAVGETIAKIAPKLCRGFGAAVRLSLRPPPDFTDQVRCTLDDVIRNTQYFYDDFSRGGWLAYSATLEPQNNYYGSVLIASDIVMQEASKKKEAAEKEASASAGFLGVKKCASSHEEVVDDSTDRRETVCDEYTTVTPGAAVGESLFGSLNWKANQIVSAERLEELVAAIIDASINRMIGLGLSSLSRAISGSDSNRNVYDDLNTRAPAGIGDVPSDIRSGLDTLDTSIRDTSDVERARNAEEEARENSERCRGLEGPALEDCISNNTSTTPTP